MLALQRFAQRFAGEKYVEKHLRAPPNPPQNGRALLAAKAGGFSSKDKFSEFPSLNSLFFGEGWGETRDLSF
jgi:hypothetical protein